MFHLFHKKLRAVATEAEKAFRREDYATAFSLCEQLSRDLLDLHIASDHEIFKKTMRDYHGLFKEFDDAESKFCELRDKATTFSNVVGEVDRTKDYAKLESSLNDIDYILSWFEDCEKNLVKSCGDAIQDITNELKAIKEIRALLKRID